MNKLKLSYSSTDKYKTCSYMWKLHYKDRLRGTTLGSALIFGSAMDESINGLLLNKKSNPTDEEKKQASLDPYAVFTESLTNVNYNNEDVYTPKTDIIDFYKKDFQLHVLQESDISDICSYASSLDVEVDSETLQEFVDFCYKQKKLDKSTKLVYNYIGWLCLHNKGILLIDAFKEDILPQIEEVFAVQKPISIKDDEDELIGFIDFIASFADRPGEKYICDLKTSSRAYAKDSVRTSDQLAIYAEAEGISNCAYVILEKSIRKRHPQTRTQVVRDNISDDHMDKVFDKITEVLYNIHDNVFKKNYEECFQYGRRCVYWNYCRMGSKKNLTKLEKRK